MNAMRVALIAHQYPPAVGGVERHVAELAQGFVRRGLEVEVVTCDPNGCLPAHAVQDGVPVHRFPTLGHDAVFFVSPPLGWWLLRNAHRFTLLHAHSYHTPLALQSLLAARWAGVPFVLTAHYHGSGHSLARRALHVPYRLPGRVLVHAAHPLICVSEVERDLLERDFGHELVTAIVPNGVDADCIRRAQPFAKDSARKLIVVAGRLEAYKQVEQVAAAMPQLPEAYELVIIGDGPARAQIEQSAAELRQGERIRLLGFLPTADLHRWLRTADVFVTLSRHEAFGITLLEAAVAGAPVVASDIPAHREVAGYLAPGRVSFIRPDCSAGELSSAIMNAARSTRSARTEDTRVPSWDDTVEGTLACYDLALRAPDRSKVRRAELRP